MTRSIILAAALATGVVPAARAQGMVVPNTPLTREQQAALDAIRDVRDSVVAASSLLAGLQRDMDRKPAPTLEEQARRITAQCSAAERQRVVSRKALAAQKFPDQGMRNGQKAMLTSMDQLKAPLGKCNTTYAPLGAAGKGEEMRDYGVSRSRPIVAGFSDFERTVVANAKQLKLPVREVLRAGPSPIDAPASVRPGPAPTS
jgi:hypothetical protein